MKIIFKEAYFEGLKKPIKISYYLGWDSTSDSPELPHYFVLFCFRLRNIHGIIYSQSHSCFYIVQIMRSLCKVHKINARWRWVETVKGTCHSIKKHANFDEI
jgi:hypothetical protein